MKNRSFRDFIRIIGLAGTAIFPLRAFNHKLLQDIIPTLIEIIGAGNSVPRGIDGSSRAPTVLDF